ncbi:replicative DNA polymerase I [Pyrobaculum islandicum DSM 4184]|uniref:DNA polymerase n=1 Tax=Pyrobaculum islandicum (strain DSM 4184 / JCM 9189 / GEO3) TaxID=384616 RepID=A1RSR0_PYRIL|nr:DNA-directed DNA polymerase I [Pyrobaculum islandicum]ABL87992.1 replicative DNA polymerase I [Pyrobaculum islandicum DSM 4184]
MLEFEEEVELEEEETKEYEGEAIEEGRVKGVVSNTVPPSIVLAVVYDGSEGKALVKFYDPIGDVVYYWYDKTGHKPYLITNKTPEEIAEKFPEVLRHPGFSHLDVEEKYNALYDKKILVTKVYAKDPLSIGGGKNSLRDILGETWESRIKYHHSYLFDRNVIPGMWYQTNGNGLTPVEIVIPPEVRQTLSSVFKPEHAKVAEEWIPLFQAPVPHIRRVAIDVEVYTPQENKIPDPKEAEYEIISVALVGSDGLKRVLMLKRPEIEAELKYRPDYEILFFDSEYELIREVFKTIVQYPIVITFNGDNFDLPYLYNRAIALGIPREEIPITVKRDYVSVAPGVHIDMYKFFAIKAIEAYAFGGVYRGERGLDGIAYAILGVGKVERQKNVSRMGYWELAEYNYRDALITLYFTLYNSEMVMKLIMLLSRIAKMPIEDITRSQVSAWIRNMLYYEHRKRGWLIPNKEDILKEKGAVHTKAIIKGKKYAGAVVLDPPLGIFFNVYVLDFASLYPSIISKWNLSYETVNCRQDAEKPIPELPHTVCRDRPGLTSTLVGILRDLRVHVYKKLAKTASSPIERQLYDVVQSAMKVFINASYGVFGAETFPLYCPPVAELTTALARYIMTSTVLKAIELGLIPVYGDTDSLFLWNVTEDKIKELIKHAEEIGIDIELDKVYKFVMFSGRKKNYLGITNDGSVIVKGIVAKKRNAPPFVKELVEDIINNLKNINSVDDIIKVRDIIIAMVKEAETKIREKRITLDKLGIKMVLSKNLSEYTKNRPQHVKAAEQLLKYGIQIGKGDAIILIKTKDSVGVKPIQLARIDEIDEKKYLEYISTSLEQILEAMGVSIEELRGATRLL